MADLPKTTQYAPSESNYLKKMMPLVQGAAKQGREIQQQRAPQQPAPAPSGNYQPVSLPGGAAGPLSKYPVTVPFQGSTRYEPQGKHTGLDIGTPTGTPIGSLSGGVVTDVRSGQGWTPNTPSYGNYVIVKDPTTGQQFRYSHLSDEMVEVGQKVNVGDILGSAGSSGSTYSAHHSGPGAHLDLRIMDLAGKYVDPTPYVYGNK